MSEQLQVLSPDPASAQGRYITAMTEARDHSREAAKVADAALDLALEDWGATGNRVLRGLAHDVVDTNARSTGRAIAALMTALAA